MKKEPAFNQQALFLMNDLVHELSHIWWKRRFYAQLLTCKRMCHVYLFGMEGASVDMITSSSIKCISG